MLLATSEITREVNRVLLTLGVVSLFLLAGITIAMVYFAVRYRRSRATTTRQIEGHRWLEITWIVIPTIIVTWMFFVGYKGFALIRTPPEDAMVVEVTGKQWTWAFHYPAEKLDTNEMVVPVDTPVRLVLSAPADDVLHSFYIPDFRVKEDVLPGRETYLWFEAERTGTYNIFCAEFCGKDHSKMLSILRVVSSPEYEQWIAAQRARRYEPLVFDAVIDPEHKNFGPDGLGIDARAVYRTFCMTCHGAVGDGSGLPGVARDFNQRAKWKRSPKVVDIFRTLTEGIKDTQMRAFPNLTPWERVAVAHYVRSFIESEQPPDTEEDFAVLVKEYELDKIRPPGQTISVDRAMELMADQAAPADAPHDERAPESATQPAANR